MAHGKVGVSKDKMCSYKHTHNSAVHTDRKFPVQSGGTGTVYDFYEPNVLSYSDYYPFGSVMPGRNSPGAEAYRYGFNGMEKDDEIKSSGNSLDFGARMYDSRLGRWLAVDPLAVKYPFASPYNFALNTPIQAKDPDGKVVLFVNGYHGFPTFAHSGGQKAHWGAKWVDKVLNQIGDYNSRFYDGSVDDRGYGGFYGRNTLDPNFRYKMGYKQGVLDAADIVNNLETGESIKIITSSMGTAYARGLSQAIMDYVDDYNAQVDLYNSKLEKNEDGTFKDISQAKTYKSVNIEYTIDLDSFQIDTPDPNADNSYYMKGEGTESKFLGTKDIKGATKVGEMDYHHPSAASPLNFPTSTQNGSGESTIENPSKPNN
jgi:RHS repeat-associated protein